MPKKKNRKKPVRFKKTAQKLNKKPIELLLAVLGLGLGILFFLLPKTPLVIIISLLLMFILFGYLVWNALEKFYWFRRAGIFILLLVLVMIGFYVWPTVDITPTKISISSNVGGAVSISNKKETDIFEVYVKIDSPKNGCSDLNNIDFALEGGDGIVNELKIAGATFDVSYCILNLNCNTDQPFIYLMIYRLKGLQSQIIKIKKRNTEGKNGQLDLRLKVVQFSINPPSPVTTKTGAGLVLNLPNSKPIAFTINAKEKKL
jgi:hypothetical protein